MNETYMNWEEYAWVCYENRWLTIGQMVEKMLECGSYSGFTEALTIDHQGKENIMVMLRNTDISL